MRPEQRGPWFSSGRTTPFLDRLRALAPERLGSLVGPDDTRELDVAGCLLWAQVPQLPDGVTANHLQVRWDGGFLGGYWGDAHLWDLFDPRDEEALVVQGLALTDEAAAEAAVDWLARQLSRPLEHSVWRNGDRILAQRWALTDTGRELGRSGRRLGRRGPPTSVTRLRPPDARGSGRAPGTVVPAG